MFFPIFLSLIFLVSAAVDQLGVDQCSCRVKATQKIIGGKISQANAYPWQISLNDEYGMHFCSGIILNSQWVLTSWKCLNDKTSSDIYVRVAVNKLSELDNKGLVFKISEIHKNSVYSLTLLKLKDPIFFTKGLIEPACINKIHSRQYIDNLVATGWGATEKTIENEFIGSFSDVLKEAFLKEDIEAGCRGGLICVKEAENNDSVCNGDEGDPIHYTENGITTVEGILDFIDGIKEKFDKEQTFCFGKAKFGRLVGAYMAWIEKIVGKEHC